MNYESQPSKLGSHLLNLDMYTNAYRDAEKNLRMYMAQAFDVQGNPKEKMLYDKAWELGHSNGIYEVFLCYADLVDLIRQSMFVLFRRPTL